MASATISGSATGTVVTIPSTTNALTALAQTALDAITALVSNGTDQSVSYPAGGPVPAHAGQAALKVSTAATLTLTASTAVNAVIDSATVPVSITDAFAEPATIIAGSGGLDVTLAATSPSSAFIVATGGTNHFTLGTWAATVAAAGNTTVSALGGGASVLAAAGGSAQLDIAGSDTVALDGQDTVDFFSAANALVTVETGALVALTTQSGSTAPVVYLAPGTETVGVTAGSAATISGSAGGLMLVSAWGGRSFVNPVADNVTVFGPGSSLGGTETLFGAGDATLPGVTVPSGTVLSNTGSDFVFGGTGYFHGGSGALNMLMSSTVAGATTLVGGGTVDLLFSQGAGDSLVGGAGTAIINAAGFSEPGFSVTGAPGGDVLAAGASNAFMFGSAWGANTILSGSGSATVYGNHGPPTAPQSGNIYIDGTGGGSLAILDFVPGIDFVSLVGHRVASVSTITASQAGTSHAPGTSVSLNDGTTITFVDQFLTQNQIQQTFR
jgi:hypothetical protein